MKHLFSIVIILLAVSTVAFASTDSKVVVQPEASRVVTTSALSEPAEALDIAEDGTLVVRVVESPEIDTKLTFYAVIISAVAVLFSAISLVVSVILQIKHNRDEVRPIVAIHLSLINMSIKIKNHGVGPAFFKKMVWKNLNSNVTARTLAGLLSDEWKELGLPTFNLYTKPFEDASNDPNVLAPQEEIFFIVEDTLNHPMSPDEKRRLGETFRDIEVQITYTDLYGKKEWTLIKNLSWMARWA